MTAILIVIGGEKSGTYMARICSSQWKCLSVDTTPATCIVKVPKSFLPWWINTYRLMDLIPVPNIGSVGLTIHSWDCWQTDLQRGGTDSITSTAYTGGNKDNRICCNYDTIPVDIPSLVMRGYVTSQGDRPAPAQVDPHKMHFLELSAGLN